MSNHETDKLVQDLQTVIQDAEALLKSAAFPGGDEFHSARERFETTIRKAKDEVLRIERKVVDNTKAAVQATDTYVKENPWQAVGVGAALGLLVGMLISRR